MAALKKAAAKTAGGSINFGDDAFYSVGFSVPDGDYVWREVDMRIHEGFGEKKQAPRLGLYVVLSPLSDPTQEFKSFWSLGSKAHLSFVPSEDGKGLEAVENGPASTTNAGTNFNMLRQSLINCAPELKDQLKNDVSLLEGMWAHMQSVPEPPERQGFQNTNTGEVAEAPRAPGKVLIVTEVKEDGKPWDGSGGEPPAAGGKKAKPSTTSANSPVNKAKPAKAAEPEEDEDAVKAAAANGISSVLEAKPKGCPKMALRVGTFKHVKSTDGDEMAQLVQKLFDDDDAIEAILGELGFTLDGASVKAV